MSKQDLALAVEAFPDARVLCVGDVMLDHFVYGQVGRISPEAPIPVVSVEHEEFMLGGAGNVVRNLAALGARVFFLTATGTDEAGAHVERLLGELPSCVPCVVRDPRRRTTIKTRYLAHGQQLLRADAESATLLDRELIDILAGQFGDLAGEASVVIVSDYAKGVLAGENARRFIEEGVGAGKPVYVDPKGNDFRRYRGATLLKPNLKELGESTRMPVQDEGGVEKAARFVIADAGVGAVLATRGAAGMMMVCDGAPAVSFGSRAREVYDVSGAGDTVAATLALGTAAGLSLEKAAELACIAAGLVVGKAGTATLSPGELLAELAGNGGLSPEKVRPLSEVQQRVRLWRRIGLRIGFAAGRFEGLRIEDVARLRRAREVCDRLVVGVFSGQDDGARAEMVAALACADLVLIIEEAGGLGVVEGLRPDFVV